MSLADEAVDIQITAGTRTPSQVGFGTPLVLSYHTVWNSSERVRRYSRPSSMISDGFTVNDAAYKMVAKIMGQTNSPKQVVVGRLPAAHAKSVELTITDATEGNVITIPYTLPDGTVGTIEYTILGGASTTSVATAVAALLNALTGIDAAGASAVITVDASTGGDVFYIGSMTGATFEDVTPDAGYDTELALIENEDPDFYFVMIDIPSYQNVLDVAAWCASAVKAFLTQTQDDQEKGASGVLGAALKAAGYKDTHISYVNDQQEYIDCALAGLVGPKKAGRVNWAWKGLTGPTVQVLSDTERGNLIGENVNYYSTVKGLSVTWDGRSSEGQYMDITRGADMLAARMQEEIVAKLANTDKVDYTDAEVDAFLGLIRAVLLRESGPGAFVVEDSIITTASEVADISVVDKGARFLPDLEWAATLRGAVNSVSVRGVLSL